MRSRRPLWVNVGWGFRLTVAAAVAVVLACVFNSLLWINRPFPGFFLWENLFVPPVSDTDWTAIEAGLPYQSRLVSMDGDPVSSADEVYRAVRKLPVGDPVHYVFEPTDGSPPVSLTIRTMRLSAPDYLWTLGSYILIGTLLILLGFVVYLMRPDAPAAQAMLIAGATWGVYLVTSADMVGPAWFRPLYLFLEAIAPVALVHIALTFPAQRRFLRENPWFLALLYVFAAAAGIASNLVFLSRYDAGLFLHHFNAIAVLAAGLVLITLLGYSFFFPPSAAARQRTKIAILGAFLAFLSPVAGYLTFYLMGVSIPANFLAMPLSLFPLAISYAIVKHDLFEVDEIIRRAVSWAVLTGLIAALYLGGVGTLEFLFAGRSGRLAQLFFLIALVALFNPLKNRLQAGIDFLFSRSRYDYRRTVAEASQALAMLLDLDTVVARILRIITQTVHAEFGAVWLHQEGGGYSLQAVSGNRDAASLPPWLGPLHPAVRRLEERPQRILSADAAAHARTARDLAEELARLGVSLVLPLSFEHRLVGFFALGEKQSGRFFSTEDLELLRTLANQGAVAVENAYTYRALVRANEDLRQAQSRLIEAERFATIGELSAAVAHGIRNPLAGIKAAAQLAEFDLPRDHPLHENIADIVSEVDKLEGRIKALLNFAKPFEPHPTLCRIDQIVADAVASLRGQMAALGIALDLRLDPAVPASMMDYAQIEQVLLALLSNAIDAMPNGGRLTVRTALVADGRRLAIEVADTGPGIPAEQLLPLFKLFFTTKSSGTGLGLAVAKKIVELHGGSIEARSEVGRGSCFAVEIPLVEPLRGLAEVEPKVNLRA